MIGGNLTIHKISKEKHDGDSIILWGLFSSGKGWLADIDSKRQKVESVMKFHALARQQHQHTAKATMQCLVQDLS